VQAWNSCRLFALATGATMAVVPAPRQAQAFETEGEAPEDNSPAPESKNDVPQREEPKTWDIELGARAGYMTGPIRGGTTPFGAGFGARLGFVFSGVYIGAGAVYFLGGTDVDLSDRSLLYGLELGYGFRFDRIAGGFLTLRPQFGFGDAAISHTDPSLAKVDVVTTASGSSSSTTSDTITVHNLYLEPAVTTMFTSGAHFAAVTGSVLVIPGISYGGSSEATTWISYGLRGELGFHF
jgi:hypothetical protein